MAQYRVQRKGTDFNKAAQDLKVDIQRLKEGVLTEMAHMVADRSPVDSGLYARSHEIALRSGSFQANVAVSEDAPRRSKGDPVSIEAAREAGLQNMLEDIAGLDLTAENFVLRNPTEHAALIEAGYTGDKTGRPPVYAAVAREGPRIIQDVAAQIKARRR